MIFTWKLLKKVETNENWLKTMKNSGKWFLINGERQWKTLKNCEKLWKSMRNSEQLWKMVKNGGKSESWWKTVKTVGGTKTTIPRETDQRKKTFEKNYSRRGYFFLIFSSSSNGHYKFKVENYTTYWTVTWYGTVTSIHDTIYNAILC